MNMDQLDAMERKEVADAVSEIRRSYDCLRLSVYRACLDEDPGNTILRVIVDQLEVRLATPEEKVGRKRAKTRERVRQFRLRQKEGK